MKIEYIDVNQTTGGISETNDLPGLLTELFDAAPDKPRYVMQLLAGLVQMLENRGLVYAADVSLLLPGDIRVVSTKPQK